jgi:hypothetical protein
LPSVIETRYTSALTSDSLTYIHPTSYGVNYYEALLVEVIETGKYTIKSNSNMNLYGYIYNGTFSPLDPSTNLFAKDDYSSDYHQLLLTVYLHVNTTYILVVTTSETRIIGDFLIIAYGPKKVTFNRISKYLNYSLDNTSIRNCSIQQMFHCFFHQTTRQY